MSIMLLGGPSARYISNLIENHQEVFSQAISNLIQSDINNYFSQAISSLIETNSLNLFSTSISQLIQDYKTDFLTALNPSLMLTGPVSITDFTQSTYFTPIYETHWDITYPGGGAVRFATNVGSTEPDWDRTYCGLAFRPYIFVDSSNTFSARLTITNMSNSTGSPASSDRIDIGFLFTSHDKLHAFGVGRNGSTVTSVTGSGSSTPANVTDSGLFTDSNITTALVGSTWEVKLDIVDDTATHVRKIKEFVRVDGGSWIQLTSIYVSTTYHPFSAIYGMKFGIGGFNNGPLFPNFGGTVTRLDIDNGIIVL